VYVFVYACERAHTFTIGGGNLAQAHSLTHTLSLSNTHTHQVVTFKTGGGNHTIKNTHAYTLSLSLSHTHTHQVFTLETAEGDIIHTHTHTHTHTRSLSFSLSLSHTPDLHV